MGLGFCLTCTWQGSIDPSRSTGGNISYVATPAGSTQGLPRGNLLIEKLHGPLRLTTPPPLPHPPPPPHPAEHPHGGSHPPARNPTLHPTNHPAIQPSSQSEQPRLFRLSSQPVNHLPLILVLVVSPYVDYRVAFDLALPYKSRRRYGMYGYTNKASVTSNLKPENPTTSHP